MEELHILARLVQDNVKKISPLIDYSNIESEETKEYQLLMGIYRGAYQTDKEAVRAIYGQERIDNKYSMLKLRLKRKLLNHLFFLDFNRPGVKVSHQYEQEVMNQIHFANMLTKKGVFTLAEDIAGKALELAKEAEFNALVVAALELLMVIYTEQHKPFAHQRTEKQLTHYRGLVNAENETTLLYQRNRLHLNAGVKSRNRHLSYLKASVQSLEAAWKQHQSFNIFEQYYKLQVSLFELLGDYTSIAKLSSDLEALHQQSHINALRFDLRYNRFIEVHAYLRTRQYDLGLQRAEEYIGDFENTTRNWFLFMENYLLLALHARKYELAQSLFASVSLNAYKNNLNGRSTERWTLYRAYLYLLEPNPDLLKGFNYHAFVASLPHYSKDKAGFNVAILILQFIQYLRENNIDALLNRVEALNLYIQRHLRSQFSNRSRLLLRLLRLIVEHNLDPKVIKQKSKYLVVRLQDTPPPGDAYAEIEIIPYEHIWEMCLDWLPVPEKKVTAR